VATKLPKHRKLPRFAARALVLVAALVVFFVLNPWRLEFQPDQDAVAAQNRLAILDFEVDGDDKQLGTMVASLLATDLSESKYVKVVSYDRVADIVRLIGRQTTEIDDRDFADEVANRADVRWILGGSVIQRETGLQIALHIIESGRPGLAAEELVGSISDESVFSTVDRLSAIVKSNLPLPPAALEEPDREVADITTRSHKAYCHYLRGLDFWSKLYRTEASKSFEMAIAFDSTFAMAYYYLATISDPTLIAEAVKYSGGSSQREQAYIRSLEAAISGDTVRYGRELLAITQQYPDDKIALYDLARHKQALGDFSEAIRLTRQALDLDPLFREAYNQLAYLYDGIGDFEQAIGAVNTYLSIAPSEANPYDTRGEIYARNGYLDLAIESYSKALQIKPDFPGAVLRLGCLYVFNKEYDLARSLYTQPLGTTIGPEYFREKLDLAHVLIHEGKLSQTVRLLDSALQQAAEMDTVSSEIKMQKANIHARMAKVLEETDPKSAVRHAEAAVKLVDQVIPEERIRYRPIYARLLATLGDYDRADSVAQEVKLHLEAKGSDHYPYWFTAGTVAFYKGDYPTALEHMEKAVNSDSPYKSFADYYLLARTYQELGRLTDAIRLFEEQRARYTRDRFHEGIWNVKMYYYLGLAYENNNQSNKAIAQYQEFLDTWQAADSGLAAVLDARKRLAQLEHQM
jgi:tetratricopeptide (TPR) repeat protein